ncbi:hypothetical protein QBC38DRAFT_46708 [Podospora fimiseda]|uniref:Uncharacterized protein n=1 Tax=Podospora fimiseda TaxID=252190 RepID=A0AAN7BHT6_9PEZI|nr:hypothetical protein QBC38DRAFT_46708 [Podospora fimiseda]
MDKAQHQQVGQTEVATMFGPIKPKDIKLNLTFSEFRDLVIRLEHPGIEHDPVIEDTLCREAEETLDLDRYGLGGLDFRFLWFSKRAILLYYVYEDAATRLKAWKSTDIEQWVGLITMLRAKEKEMNLITRRCEDVRECVIRNLEPERFNNAADSPLLARVQHMELEDVLRVLEIEDNEEHSWTMSAFEFQTLVGSCDYTVGIHRPRFQERHREQIPWMYFVPVGLSRKCDVLLKWFPGGGLEVSAMYRILIEKLDDKMRRMVRDAQFVADEENILVLAYPAPYP